MGVIAVFIGGFNHYAAVGKYIECVEFEFGFCKPSLNKKQNKLSFS